MKTFQNRLPVMTVFLAVVAAGQNRPNLTGTWELTSVERDGQTFSPAKTNSGETHVIVHREPKLTFNMTLRRKGSANRTVELAYTTDGVAGQVGYKIGADGARTPINGSAHWEGQTMVYEQQFPNAKQNQLSRIIRYLQLEKGGTRLSARNVYWLEGRQEKLEAKWTWEKKP
jgi:hypothetical protein